MKALDIMTGGVVSVGTEATVLEAIRLMLEHKISGVPIVDGRGLIVGAVTEGDFLRRAETGTERRRPHWLEFLMGPGRLAAEYVHSHGRTVSEVMTPDPITTGEETPLSDIVSILEERRIKWLPVVRDGRVVGIITRADLLHAIATVGHEMSAGDSSDAEIREHILAELDKQPWAPKDFINPVVRNGTVELWGSIFDERERQAVRVVVENVAGVKSVKDHLVWTDPMSGKSFEGQGEQPGQSAGPMANAF
jgi:CBS domain-containing protein